MSGKIYRIPNIDMLNIVHDDLYKLAFEGTNDGLWFFDLNRELLYFSRRALEILGYEENKVFTAEEAYNDLLNREHSPAIKEWFESHMGEELTNYDSELSVRTKSGGSVWLRVRGKFIMRDNDGKPRGIAGTYEDITERKRSSGELRKSQKEFQTYFDSAAVGMSVNGIDKELITVNQELCRMLGYTREELITMTWADLTHPDDLALCFDEFDKTIAGLKDVVRLEKRYIRKDGSVVYTTVSIVCQRKDDGKVSHYISTYVDNTERHLLQEKEKQEHKLLRTLIDNLPSNIYVLDINGRKVISNMTDVVESGYSSEEEVINKTQEEILKPPFGRMVHRENMEVLRTGIPVLEKEKDVSGIYAKMKFMQVSKIPLYSENNEITGLVSFSIDITALRETEMKVRQSEEYFRTLVDLAPYGIVTVDNEGIITYISKAAQDILQIPDNEDARSMWLFRFVSPADRDQAISNFNEIANGNRMGRKWEFRCLTFDNKAFWAEVIASPLRDPDGKISGMMVMCHDITLRKNSEEELLAAKEKAEQSDKFKTALIRNISHEIRTPLNAILGFSDLITEPDLPAQEKSKYIDIINEASMQLLKTIDNLVNLSTIEARITKTLFEEVDLHEILYGVYNRFHIKAVNKNIRLRVDEFSDKNNLKIHTDRMKLYQVMSHLVENALKFTWYGEISIGYVILNDVIQFYVRDTGIGIPGDLHSKIFENFFQIDSSIDRRLDGIGLGLPICKAYVELIGGKIWVDSEPNRGSTFYFTIPYNGTAANRKEKPHTLEIPNSENITVLVVDDLESNLRYLEELLSLHNIKVRSAVNGAEAVEICRREESLDVVLMDLKMPVMDGFEAASHIRKIKPHLPLIAQSAYDNEKNIVFDSGFDDFLCKPFTRSQVISMIRKHVKINPSLS